MYCPSFRSTGRGKIEKGNAEAQAQAPSEAGAKRWERRERRKRWERDGVAAGAAGVGGLAGQLAAGARRTSQVTYSAMGSPLATSGRFCRRIQPERPRSGSVSPGQRSRRRTTPAENRTEAKDPWQNQGPFPAEPPRSRMATVNANRGRRCVQKEACVSQSCIPNTPPSPVHQINAISMPGTAFQFANPFQRVCLMTSCSGRIGCRCDPDTLLKILKHAVDDRLDIRYG